MASPRDIPKTCGAVVGRDQSVHGNMNIYVNSQPSSSQASAADNSPFRCNLPIPTPHYKGRADILDKIFDQSTDGATEQTNSWQRMAAIVGIGGMGKSETACHFAKIYREAYPCVAWIDAETQESTLNSFLSLAKRLEIVSQGRQRADTELVRNVFHHIDKHYCTRVLLIFDNAIQLHSSENDFGIFDYLPTEDLANQRFPFVIITSQTPDWQKGIKVFKLEELSEEESVDFFRSSFGMASSECDEDFKKLHSNLQGYPLAMTLAASNIDFDSQTDSSIWLQEQVQMFIEKFEAEDSSILTQKINRNWTSKYNKTLSTVWQLSFQRLQAQPNGANALTLLQAVSFFHVPVNTDHLRWVFIECHFCPGTPDWMKFDSLKESIRILQRFHIMHCAFQKLYYFVELEALQSNAEKQLDGSAQKFEEELKSAKPFGCELRVHRLVQLVVRLQMDFGPVQEDILRFLACWSTACYVSQLNVPAVEEAIEKNTLTPRALAFVGLLELQGNMAAKIIVQRSNPPTDGPAAAIWRLIHLNKDIETLNPEAIEVLRRFVELSTFEKSLVDKRCFAAIVLKMFYQRRLFRYVRDDGTLAQDISLECFTGIEEIACELLSTCFSLTDVCSRPLLCLNVGRLTAATCTLELANKILQHFIDTDMPENCSAVLTQMLRTYREFLDRGTYKWYQLREEMSQLLYSKASWTNFESEVESCRTDQRALKQVFSTIFNKILLASAGKNFNDRQRWGIAFQEIDLVVYRVLHNEHDLDILLPLMEAFLEVLTQTAKEKFDVFQNYSGNPDNALIWISLTWINFAVQDKLLNSDILFRHLANATILAQIKTMPADKIRAAVQCLGSWKQLQQRHGTRLEKFIENYSQSQVEEIRYLLTTCRELQRELPLVRKQLGQPLPVLLHRKSPC